jgi:protease-4
MIVRGRGGTGLFGGRRVGDKDLVECFERCRKEPNIKAVVFRVDSPGGSALASELIYQAVARCAKDKPVIASVADVAASGGYYVAVGSRRIIADPSAIVGSIGVVGGKLAVQGLLNKLKIQTHAFTRGRNAGLRLSRPWDEREQAVIRRLAQRVYETFVSRVRASRGKRIRDIEAVAQGRVFTARQGLQNGLVDELGGLRVAVLAAQKAAGLKAADFLTLPRPRTLGDLLTEGPFSSAAALPTAEEALLRGLLRRSPAAVQLLETATLLTREQVLAVMPYALSIRR